MAWSKCFLEKKANVKAQLRRVTPLQKPGRIDIVKLLSHNVADISVASCGFNGPAELHTALERQHANTPE